MLSSLKSFGIGLAAGVAAAVMVLSAQRQPLTSPAFISCSLFCFSPLPLMIATLGWGRLAGLVALFCATALMMGLSPFYALGYLFSIVAPAWMLAVFTITPAFYLRRPKDLPPAYPNPGAISVFAALLFIIQGIVVQYFIDVNFVGVDGIQFLTSSTMHKILSSGDAPFVFILGPEQLRKILKLVPTVFAVLGLLIYLVNLYLAARSVQISQRLSRPWCDISTGFQLPRTLSILTVIALVLAFHSPSPIADYSRIITCTFATLYVFLGLATLHALTRNMPARPFLLVALYLSCILAPQFVLPILSLLGIIENFVRLRELSIQTQSF